MRFKHGDVCIFNFNVCTKCDPKIDAVLRRNSGHKCEVICLDKCHTYWVKAYDTQDEFCVVEEELTLVK